MKTKVLVVESSPELCSIWCRHLERLGLDVTCANNQDDAVRQVREGAFDVIVLDLVLEGGGAFAVADYASYRLPEARVVFVTNTTFFSDGSIFQHIPNACAFVQSETPPDDLAAIVEHYAAN
ncbi:response regulator transcription factor [Aestuariibius sp. 2305UL40-4]|uniref:response regulator transcription factor n=1 Tax=Aestuariibius violaceus TaxID=3234132 RepID=UPI00345E461D